MNISNYFVVFYLNGKPIDSFNFSEFSDYCLYISPCIINGKYRLFNVYTHDDHLYKFDIPNYDYHVYWPISLKRLYNHLVFHHNFRSSKLIPHKYYSAYYGDFQGEDYVGVYEIWRDDDRNSNRYFFGDDAYFRYRDNFDRFRKRFKAIIVMK